MATPVEEFAYVVERKLPDPICFGTKILRDTTPIGKGLSPFQKRAAPELLPTSAAHYDADVHSIKKSQQSRVTSKKGYGSAANAAPRFPQSKALVTPSAFRYAPSLTWKVPKETRFSFGLTPEKKKRRRQAIPGPGTYNLESRKCRRTRFAYNFGHPTMQDTVEIFCVQQPVNVCHKCKDVCKGDYWHNKYTLYLCHLCWLEERYTQEIYTYDQLRQFQKIRDCSFLHEHEGTTAAIQLLPKNKLKKKIRLENYLDLYLSCWEK